MSTRPYDNIESTIEQIKRRVWCYCDDLALGRIVKGKPSDVKALMEIRKVGWEIENSYQQLISDNKQGMLDQIEYEKLNNKYTGNAPLRDYNGVDEYVKHLIEKQIEGLKGNKK